MKWVLRKKWLNDLINYICDVILINGTTTGDYAITMIYSRYKITENEGDKHIPYFGDFLSALVKIII